MSINQQIYTLALARQTVEILAEQCQAAAWQKLISSCVWLFGLTGLRFAFARPL